MRERASSQPFLVEIIGVAGAGKSTLTRTLCDGNRGYQRAEFIHTRKPVHLSYVARCLPRLMPILVANLHRKPRLSWADFKLMVYVTEWRRLLFRRQEYSSGVTLLDQGPMYALVRLKAQDRGVMTGRYFQRWWEQMVLIWIDTLSAVVWLDAPDAVLQARIDERTQEHAVKGEALEVGRQFISRYRVLFDAILHDIELPGGPKLLRFDTSDKSPELIAAELRSVLPAGPKS